MGQSSPLRIKNPFKSKNANILFRISFALLHVLTLNVKTLLGSNEELLPWSEDVLTSSILCANPPSKEWSPETMAEICRDGYYKGVKEAADPVIVTYNLSHVTPYSEDEGWLHVTLKVALPEPATKIILIERIAIQAIAVATSTFVGRFTDTIKCQDTWDKTHRGPESTSKNGATTSPLYCNGNDQVHIKNEKETESSESNETTPSHPVPVPVPVPVPNLERAQMFTMTNVSFEDDGELHLDFNLNEMDNNKIGNGSFYFLSFIAVNADYSGQLKKICLTDQRSSAAFALPETWPTFDRENKPEPDDGCTKRKIRCHEYEVGTESSSTTMMWESDEKDLFEFDGIRDTSIISEPADPLTLSESETNCNVENSNSTIKPMNAGRGRAIPAQMRQTVDASASNNGKNYNRFHRYENEQKLVEEYLRWKEEFEKIEDSDPDGSAVLNAKINDFVIHHSGLLNLKPPITTTTTTTTTTAQTPHNPRKKGPTEKPFHGVREIPPYLRDPNVVIPVEKSVRQLEYAPESGDSGENSQDQVGVGHSMEIKSDGLSVHEVYSGCGKKKGCVGDPGQCIRHKSCQSIISYGEDDLRVKFQIMGKAGKYVAIGLSDDMRMGDDSVVECVREYGTQINAYVSWNHGRNNKREKDQSTISGVRGAYTDGYIICEFWRLVKTVYQNRTFDLGKERFHVLHARGNSATEGLRGNVGYHDEGSTATKIKYKLNERFEKIKLRLLLEKLHSSLMVVSWLFCFPLAAFLARYFKETYTNKEIRGYTIWYSWHMILTCMGAVMTFLAMVSISAGSGWFVGQGPNKWNYHNKTGMALVAIVVVELVTGCLINVFNTRFKCQIANYLHGFCGHASFFIAFANMYNSTTFDNGLPCSGATLLTSWLVMYIVIHLLMSYQICYVDFVRGYYISRAYNIFHIRAIPHPADEDITGSPVRKIFLCMFTSLSMFFTLALIGGYLFLAECRDTSLE